VKQNLFCRHEILLVRHEFTARRASCRIWFYRMPVVTWRDTPL
jgi:hypothetical protein